MPATPTFYDGENGILTPARHAEAITPNDSADLTFETRALYVGGAGNAQVTLEGGDTVTLTGLLAGVVYPLRVTRVLAASTTATNLVGLR